MLTVCSGTKCVKVDVVDCLCSRKGGIDLYADAFERLAALSAGVLRVNIRW